MMSVTLAPYTKNLALAFYALARGTRVPEREPFDYQHQCIALVMAAVWLACEHGTCDPWERRVALPPMMTRDQFLDMARSIYDCWQTYRPPATLFVLEGGRPRGGDDGR
jgi:hypothetical protein